MIVRILGLLVVLALLIFVKQLLALVVIAFFLGWVCFDINPLVKLMAIMIYVFGLGNKQ